MKIKIWDDKYMIKSDSYCYKLIELGEADKDEEDEEKEDIGKTVGYFGSIEDLFVSLSEREGRLNKCTTLNGYIKHIEAVNKKMEEILEQIKVLIGAKASIKRLMTAMPEDLPKEVENVGEESQKSKKRGRKKKSD